jgi:flagellin-like protein
MNMRGVSPVVATVLLIAIAVVAAVGVWYWVGSYTSKPATTSTDLKSIDVTCTANVQNIIVKNMGTGTMSAVSFTVYNSNYSGVATFSVSTASLTSIASALNTTAGLVAGTYRATSNGYQDEIFTCY